MRRSEVLSVFAFFGLRQIMEPVKSKLLDPLRKHDLYNFRLLFVKIYEQIEFPGCIVSFSLGTKEIQFILFPFLKDM